MDIPAERTRIGSRTDGLGHSILSGDAWSDVAESLNLSPRELEIVQCIFDDEKQTVIARRLHISVHTVNTHLERLYRKLDVHSRVQLVVRIVACWQSLDGGSVARLSDARPSPVHPTDELPTDAKK